MSTYTLIKLEELNGGTPAIVINNADILHIKQGGVDKFIPFSSFKSQIPNYAYLAGIFDNTNLDGTYRWTFNHAKNTRNVTLKITNPAGEVQQLPYIIIDSNNIAVDFGGPIETGDWEYLFQYWAGSPTGAYPDTTYALASHNHDGGAITMLNTGRNAAITGITEYFRIDDKMLVGYIIAKSSVAGSLIRYGNTPTSAIIPPTGIFPFIGTCEDWSYESGRGAISNNQHIDLYFGKANTNYHFVIIMPLL
jgi:hypothetical protein